MALGIRVDGRRRGRGNSARTPLLFPASLERRGCPAIVAHRRDPGRRSLHGGHQRCQGHRGTARIPGGRQPRTASARLGEPFGIDGSELPHHGWFLTNSRHRTVGWEDTHDSLGGRGSRGIDAGRPHTVVPPFAQRRACRHRHGGRRRARRRTLPLGALETGSNRGDHLGRDGGGDLDREPSHGNWRGCAFGLGACRPTHDAAPRGGARRRGRRASKRGPFSPGPNAARCAGRAIRRRPELRQPSTLPKHLDHLGQRQAPPPPVGGPSSRHGALLGCVCPSDHPSTRQRMG